MIIQFLNVIPFEKDARTSTKFDTTSSHVIAKWRSVSKKLRALARVKPHVAAAFAEATDQALGTVVMNQTPRNDGHLQSRR